MCLGSQHVPPVIVIKLKDGNAILEELKQGRKVKLHVDFDMVKKFEIFF